MADNLQVQAERSDDPQWAQVLAGLQRYDLNVKRAVPAGRGQYRLEGDTQVHYARVLPHAEAAWRMYVADSAANGGFMRVERAVHDRFAQRIQLLDEATALTVTHHWDGAPLQVTPDDVRDAGYAVAQLHEALAIQGANDAPTGPAEAKPRYGTWEAALQRARDTLTSQLQAASRQGEDSEWQDAMQAWVSVSDRALSRLRTSGYSHRAATAREQGMVAWNGLNFERLTRLPSGAIGVMQAQTPVLDDPLYDLAALCRDAVETGQPDGVSELLAAYAAVRPLDTPEQDMVVAFAAFPHMAVLLVQRARRGQRNDGWQMAARRQITAANSLLR